MGKNKEKSKKRKRAILLFFLPSLIAFVIRLLLFLCKKEYKLDEKTLKWAQNNSVILAFWHGELLMQAQTTVFFSQIKKMFVLISEHFDGELISKVVHSFGIDSIRGSSSKGGAKALLSCVKKLSENNTLIAITPDGPRGPYHSVADGIVFLAQKSNKPIVVCRIFFSRSWQMKSWDKFKIPKPFSKITYVLSEPIFLTKEMDLESAKKQIQNAMEKDL